MLGEVSMKTENASGVHDFRAVAADCIDRLIEHGTDRYGEVHAPILVSILDAATLTCPESPRALDERWRVTRRGRRNPAGANLLMDQPTLAAMFALSDATGVPSYSAFAERYIAWYLTHLVDEKGFWWWGWHRHYDVYRDTRDGHDGNHHEFHALHTVLWDEMWAIDADSVRREIEAIWTWHVIDKTTGEVNRHGDGRRGCDFSMTSAAFSRAFAFLFARTGEHVWRERAVLLAGYFWDRRNPTTDLIAARPNAGAARFDGSHLTTAEIGLNCRDLLSAFEYCGDERLLKYAVAYLRAYARYGYDRDAGKFWGALRLDGSPETGARITAANVDSNEGYGAFEPRGHLDIWQPYVAGYEHPTATAEVYAIAYELTRDDEMLETALRFATSILSVSPPRACLTGTWYEGYAREFAPLGAYAEQYGRAIEFLSRLGRATGDRRFTGAARELATDAVTRLAENGLVRGHPAKPYYEATDGVGFLLRALIRLDETG